MTKRLEGKRALVTGAASGIGRAIARAYVAEGAHVACVDLNREGVEAIAAELGNATAHAGDISDSDFVDNLVREVAGEGGIDILVNNAGILDGFTPLTDTTNDLWNRILSVNLFGAFYFTRAALPGMVERGGGAIVNVASIAGVVAGAGGAAYTASKHGLVGLTKETALEYGPKNVRCNAICPGAVESALTAEVFASDGPVMDVVRSVPAGRHGQPEEIAKLAVYLASEDATFVHGSVMLIDGGWTCR